MASASLTCVEWDRKPVYWSTIAYLRVWWASDGARLAAIRAAKCITPEMLRDLGVEYNVNRSIIRTDKKKGAADVNAQKICDLLKTEIPNWTADLESRIIFCKKIITQIKPFTHRETKELASATTKFIWFLAPDGWTIYDKFAAIGIRLPSKGKKPGEPSEKASGKMGRFYRLLSEYGFAELVQEMQEKIDASQLFQGKQREFILPATRVVDKLLMARGGRGGDQVTVDELKVFLDLLPSDLSTSIQTLANELQILKPDHVLTTSTRPPIRRSRKR